MKAKWKNMRDYYRAELRKHPPGKSGAGSDDVSTSTWPLFKNLSYLRNTMKTRPRFTNIETKLDENEEDLDTEDQNYANISDTLFTQESSVTDGDLENTDTDITSGPSGKIKRNYDVKSRQTAANNFRRELLNMEAKKIKLLENEEKEDEDFLFLKSLLPDLKNLPRTQKMKTKIKFQEILLNETIGLTSTVTTPRSSYENTSSTYSNPSPHPIEVNKDWPSNQTAVEGIDWQNSTQWERYSEDNQVYETNKML